MKITIDGLTKTFGSETAVDDVTVTAEEGNLTTLVGPSGCGKTTTMRCIAGLERPDTGVVQIGDQVVTDLENKVFVSPGKRDIGMVFQSFDVWPHLTVFENVAFPLEIRDFTRSEIEEKVMEVLELADIAQLRDKNASDLSGGQQARVGITRALVYEPKVLLCDEPLTGLDRNLRAKMRYDIREIQKELGITTVYVTHSQREAMAISDEIILMNAGRVEQSGGAEDIYNHPRSRYAFDFFGSTEFFPGTADGKGAVRTDFGTVTTNATDVGDGGEVEIGFRPEVASLRETAPEAANGNVWQGTVVEHAFLGEIHEYIVDVGGSRIRSRSSTRYGDIDVDDSVYLTVDPEEIFVFRGEEHVA